MIRALLAELTVWWPGLKSSPLEPKDLITISVSVLAFLISAGVALFNWWSWRRKNLDDAKKAFTEAITAMITGRQKLDEFRYQSGDKFGTLETQSYRIALTDQRQLYLSKAQQILRKYKRRLSPSYFEYMILAANLIDLGRPAESVSFYESALQAARANNDQVALAATRRVCGRAKVAVGQHDQGRKEMLSAIDGYTRLASQPYDQDRMFEEAAETYRRLIWVQHQAGKVMTLQSDLKAMEELIKCVKDPTRVRVLTAGLNELRTAVDSTSKPSTPESATQLRQDASASPPQP